MADHIGRLHDPRVRVLSAGRLEDNALVRAIQRVPLGVQAKLLGALFVAVAVVVVVGILGLRAIADANDRATELRSLQGRATVYRALQADVELVHQLLGLRAGGPDLNTYTGSEPTAVPTGQALVTLDGTISTTLTRLGPGGDVTDLSVEPAAAERATLDEMLSAEARLADAMRRITALDDAGRSSEAVSIQGTEAEPIRLELETLTDRLVAATTNATDALLAADAASLDDARRTFVLVAAGAAFLALLVGSALAWSVIGPVRRIEGRLAAIAEGDFGAHVTIPNRDELGALASDLNRMSDELGRLYRELEDASRHKSEFLANMSHELRTPLNAIIGFSDVLDAEMAGPLNERQRQYVTDVREAGQHLLALINDVLDLSKVEAGRMELALTDMSVADALASGLTMHEARASRHDVALSLTVAPDVGVIRADERKVRQVVFNLVSNAVKFTPSGGRVDVTAERHDDEIEIAVADTGVGIAQADQVRIFDEFVQAADAPGTAEGTGLGLALARRFVELHGGRIWVQSQPGIGTTFRFTLPAGAAA